PTSKSDSVEVGVGLVVGNRAVAYIHKPVGRAVNTATAYPNAVPAHRGVDEPRGGFRDRTAGIDTASELGRVIVAHRTVDYRHCPVVMKAASVVCDIYTTDGAVDEGHYTGVEDAATNAGLVDGIGGEAVVGAVPADGGPDQRQSAAVVDAAAAAVGADDSDERLDGVPAHGTVKQRQGTTIVVDTTAAAEERAEDQRWDGLQWRHAAVHDRYVDGVPGHGTIR